VRLADKLITRLNGLGLGSMQIVGGDTAGSGTGYAEALFDDSTVMQKVFHLAFHDYSQSATSTFTFDGAVQNSGWAGRNFWVTEYAGYLWSGNDTGTEVPNEWDLSKESFVSLYHYLANGAAGAMFYDGIDALYQHHDFKYNTMGAIKFNQITSTYSIRKRMYALEQFVKFVRPGMVRIDSSDSVNGLLQLAFKDPNTGKVVIVGANFGGTAQTIRGYLQGGLTANTLQLYQTDGIAKNVTRLADVAVGGGAFSVTIPAGTIFTLKS
jgi:O-glycosyl hydrolase